MIDKLLDSQHLTPAFKIVAHAQDKDKKQDITDILTPRLISLTLTDVRGFEADQLDLTLDDSDGKLAIPSRGVSIELAIGWKGSNLINKGMFTVDEVEISGSPDIVTIRARSADLRGSLNTKKERSFHNMFLGALIILLAEENNLKPMCSDELGMHVIEHIDQTNESTINFLTRLAEQYDAIATVKNGSLLFIPTGAGTTASGKPLGSVVIKRNSGDGHRFCIAESQNFTAVRAYWQNTDHGTKGEVVIDKNTEIKRVNQITKTGKTSKNKKNQLVQHKPVETDAEKMKTLRHVYKTEANAINGANAAFKKIKRGVATFSINLAIGRPELFPELPTTVIGFKDMIDSTDWIITKVTHNISRSGYVTAVELEIGDTTEE